jgi:membrane protein DedA with SNARE-associated domain
MEDTSAPERKPSLVPRNRYLAVCAAVILLLSLLALAGVLHLPSGRSSGGEGAGGSSSSGGGLFSLSLFTSLLDIGYAGLFALMFMESASLPIPSEVVLPLAGYLVYLGKMNLGLAIIDSTIAALIGALVDYYLALWLGRPVIYGLLRRVGISPSHLDEGERWVDSRGSWSVFIGRFIPIVRTVISIPAGLLRMRLSIFVALTAAGSLLWSALLIYLGYSAGPLWQSAVNSLSAFANQAALVIIALLCAIYLAYYLGAFGRRRG